MKNCGTSRLWQSMQAPLPAYSGGGFVLTAGCCADAHSGAMTNARDHELLRTVRMGTSSRSHVSGAGVQGVLRVPCYLISCSDAT